MVRSQLNGFGSNLELGGTHPQIPAEGRLRPSDTLQKGVLSFWVENRKGEFGLFFEAFEGGFGFFLACFVALALEEVAGFLEGVFGFV